LAIKFFGMGSILLMYPMLKSLKYKYPSASITLLTFGQNKDLARLLHVVDRAAFIEFRQGLAPFLLQTLKIIADLRRRRYDLVFDCEFFSYFSALAVRALSWPETVSVGFFSNRLIRDGIFAHRVAIDCSQHVAQLFARMVDALGGDQVPFEGHESYDLAIPESSLVVIDSLIKELGVQEGGRLVAVNINAGDLCYNRRWPACHFGALLEMILRDSRTQGRIHFVLLGAKEDESYVRSFEQRFHHPKILNLAGRLELPELAALLKKCSLFIGNDSGPLHLAVACGVRTASFFGPETPRLYGPLGHAHRVFYADIHCSPCLNIFFSKQNDCSDNQCLKRIDPEKVFPRVMEMLFPPEKTEGDVV
jgi:ADP-heptose:LPS heptosyltransferase